MSTDLVAFLRARLDEDEQTARRADSIVWPSREVQVELDDPLHHAWRGTQLSPTMARHIVRHGPKRVLADVDAKRRTLVRCEEAMLAANPMLVHFAGQTLREMALAYAAHPGYAEAIRSTA